MSLIIDPTTITDSTPDEDDQQQALKTKIIKCKTNNQQIQMPSYNILTSNGSPSASMRSIDPPNEHTSIKLHIRRVCSPSSTDSTSIHPTSNLLSQPSADFNDLAAQPTKLISRQFFNSNDISTSRSPPIVSRRLISTRRSSLIDTDSYHTSSSIYTLQKAPINNNEIHVHDENTLKKPATKTTGNKRKTFTEQQEKKRTKSTPRPIKAPTNNASKFDKI